MKFLHQSFTRSTERDLRLRSVLLISLIPLLAAPGPAQGLPEAVAIPATATALEGFPSVLVSSGDGGTEKKILTGSEARKDRLLVTVVKGKFYWASRGNRPLHLHESGDFTYLFEGPGAYIKFTKIGKKILYMEHANIFLSTVTYWGELQIITGR